MTPKDAAIAFTLTCDATVTRAQPEPEEVIEDDSGGSSGNG